MNERYIIESNPKGNEENVIQGDCYRITLLTDGLIRLEYNKNGVFEDRASQMVLNRCFPKVPRTIIEDENSLDIITERLSLHYNKDTFSPHGLTIEVKGALFPYGNCWHYGMEKPVIDIPILKGTARTLDGVNGATELEEGLMSQFGFSLVDDSKTLLIREDGWVEPRSKDVIDLYFFGYGHDYRDCLKAFYELSGKAPMIPRYALGNWWSRYYPYNQDEYLALMDRFKKASIPFSVAVIDMDWHLVQIDEKYGSGWTGYTWNTDLFPEPEAFMKGLHDRDMAITLNVHPAEGIRAYEEPYRAMATRMGVNIDEEQPVRFDVSNEAFMSAYFEEVHHPHEEKGVDFWWIDWQQGSQSKIEGLDPLWMLNHYHFLDNGREHQRPMTFSRYAGPGSHRYPIGFSGDTIATWESLDFQPYFTASASNIGYTMWSHDIGGHMQGYRDEVMSARWYQYGVFSPIMRLHSSNSLFNSKEPWNFSGPICDTMSEFLRLRHELIPYLYTMLYRQYKEGLPLVEPMYYTYPTTHEAYDVKNQYFFGSQLMVAPITTPNHRKLHLGKVDVWLPEGRYTDLFTGMTYIGNRRVSMYRDVTSIPVLVKDGGIIPRMEYNQPVGENPKQLRLDIYTGDSGSFTLYEDDNVSDDYKNGNGVTSSYLWNQESSTLTLCKSEGCCHLIPKKRRYTLHFHHIHEVSAVYLDGHALEDTCIYTDENGLHVTVNDVSVEEDHLIRIEGPKRHKKDPVGVCLPLLQQAEIEYGIKEAIYGILNKGLSESDMMMALYALHLDEWLYGAIIERLTTV